MKQNEKLALRKSSLASPQKIYDYISEFVTGQEFAKKVVSVAIFLHHFSEGNEIEYCNIKQNLMMIGPTGTGKTYLLKTLAKILNIPLAIVSATAYTQAGYVGEDVENIFTILLEEANGNIEEAQHGIVFLDEIDKIARVTSSEKSIDRDVSGIGVQQALLTILEGSKIRAPKARGEGAVNRAYVEFDTSNILFVCSGAFVGLTKLIEKRVHQSAIMRHDDLVSAEKHPLKRQDQLLSKLLVEDVIEFGFIPEFAGRFTQYVTLNNLYKNDLLGIISSKNNSVIEQYKPYFKIHGIKLEVEQGYLETIADIALEMGTGARGLRLLVTRSLTNIMFELPNWSNVATCLLTKNILLENAPPILYSKRGIPVMLDRTKVFVSYSHKDSAYVDELIKLLKPLQKTRDIEVWSDNEIAPGENWQERINDTMSRSKIAVFFISSDFLASDYAMQELEYFLEVKDNEKVTVLWVLVSSCLYDEYEIAKFQAAHDIQDTIETLSSPCRKKIWVDISKVIKDNIAPLKK